MERINTTTPIEILIVLGIVYAAWKIVSWAIPYIMKGVEERINDQENKLAVLDTTLVKYFAELSEDIKGVLHEIKEITKQMNENNTGLKVLETKVKRLEARMEKVEGAKERERNYK